MSTTRSLCFAFLYFLLQAMFESKMQESQQNCVQIEDANETTVMAMLQYMYSDEAPQHHIAADLLILADKYQMSDLQIACQTTLSEGLTFRNVVDSVLLADRYPTCQSLKDVAIKFIVENFEMVLRTDSFQELMKTRQDLTSEIILRSIHLMREFN